MPERGLFEHPAPERGDIALAAIYDGSGRLVQVYVPGRARQPTTSEVVEWLLTNIFDNRGYSHSGEAVADLLVGLHNLGYDITRSGSEAAPTDSGDAYFGVAVDMHGHPMDRDCECLTR